MHRCHLLALRCWRQQSCSCKVAAPSVPPLLGETPPCEASISIPRPPQHMCGGAWYDGADCLVSYGGRFSDNHYLRISRCRTPSLTHGDGGHVANFAVCPVPGRGLCFLVLLLPPRTLLPQPRPPSPQFLPCLLLRLTSVASSCGPPCSSPPRRNAPLRRSSIFWAAAKIRETHRRR